MPSDLQPATYQYDTDSLLTQLNFGGRTVAYTRHPGNGLLQSASVGSLAETWSHNGFAEPTGYSAVWGTSPRLSFAYTRDKLGRITQVQEDGSRTTGYAYDLAGRLIRVTRNGEQIAEYGYDANSNRITATYAASLASTLSACAPNTGPLTADVDAQDRMTRYGTCVYAYGANGERVQKTDTASGHITAYQYDEFGNLRQVNLPDGRTISYGIDGLNRRVTKSIDGQLQGSWLYKDALEPIAELDAAGNFVSLFAYGEKPHVPSLIRKGSTTYRIVSDHLGSVRQVINLSTGAVVQALDYDAWGNVLQDTNPGFQPFGFAGGLYDRDTGLVRFGARDYDPVSGRWTAKDPMGFAAKDTNLYVHSFNDPVNYIDLTGEEAHINEFAPGSPGYAAASRYVSPRNAFVWAGHGNAVWAEGKKEGYITPAYYADEIVRRIRESGWTEGQPVELLWCHSGAGSDPVAKDVAAKLKTKVYGAQDYVWWAEAGDMYVAPRTPDPNGVRGYSPIYDEISPLIEFAQ